MTTGLNPPAIGAAMRRRWFGQPLTARLTTIIVGLLFMGLVLAGTTVVGILQSHLVGQVDAQLEASASKVAVNAAQQQLGQGTTNIPTSYYVRVHLGDAKATDLIPPTAQTSSGLPNATDLARLERATGRQKSLPTTVKSTQLGQAWRAQAVPVFTNDEAHTKIGTVIVALPLTNVQETLNNTAFYLLIASSVLIAAGGFAAYYLVRLSLSELRSIEVVAGRIASGDMSERIVTKEPPSTEVGSLALSLNKMLGRIERLFLEQQRSEEKMRQFVSDASHELRTPLAAVRGYGELYRLGGVPEERVGEVMARIESEATRLGGLVDDLLRLARLDEGRRIHIETVDVVELAREAAMDLTALDPSREVALLGLDGSDAPATLPTLADPSLFSQVLTNLVGNVDRYTPAGSPVEICVGTIPLSHPMITPSAWPRSPYLVGDHEPDEAVVVEVRDHGPGIPEKERERVFERFYRTDDSRSRDTGGTGLGLSIVKTVADVLGGGVKATETPGGGLTMRIAFPHRLPDPPTSERKGSPK